MVSGVCVGTGVGIEVEVGIGLVSACCVVGSDAPHATGIATQQRVIIAAIGRFMPMNLSWEKER